MSESQERVASWLERNIIIKPQTKTSKKRLKSIQIEQRR
jgi:hypothetical protein